MFNGQHWQRRAPNVVVVARRGRHKGTKVDVDRRVVLAQAEHQIIQGLGGRGIGCAPCSRVEHYGVHCDATGIVQVDLVHHVELHGEGHAIDRVLRVHCSRA